jgi:hypothetical protein
MEKSSRRIIFVWGLIVLAIACGTFLMCKHLGNSTGGRGGAGAAPAGSQPNASSVAMQNFSNNGYAFSVPTSWSIEMTSSDTIAVHPDASSSIASCKVEVSAFSYASSTDTADWISRRIGADPSVSVAQRSSEDVSVSGGSGVKWTGTIDGIPTTLVYLFGDHHAYEIAPSAIGEGADGAPQCGDMLQTLLSAFTI